MASLASPVSAQSYTTSGDKLAENVLTRLLQGFAAARQRATNGTIEPSKLQKDATSLFNDILEISFQGLADQGFNDMFAIDYTAQSTTRTAGVKVMCDDSLHDKVQKVLLERTAVQVAGHLQYDAPGPRTTGAACVYGCVQLMVWTRQLTAHHEPAAGAATRSLGDLIMRSLDGLQEPVGPVHLTMPGHCWTPGKDGEDPRAAPRLRCALVSPVCLVAGERSLVSVTVQAEGGEPFGPLRVLLLDEAGGLVEEVEELAWEQEADGAQTVRFEASACAAGYCQLLLLSRDTATPSHVLQPLLCASPAAAQQLERMFRDVLLPHHAQALQAVSPASDPQQLLRAAQRAAWQGIQALTNDIAFLIEGHQGIARHLHDGAHQPVDGSSDASSGPDDRELVAMLQRVLEYLARHRQQHLFTMLVQRVVQAQTQAASAAAASPAVSQGSEPQAAAAATSCAGSRVPEQAAAAATSSAASQGSELVSEVHDMEQDACDGGSQSTPKAQSPHWAQAPTTAAGAMLHTPSGGPQTSSKQGALAAVAEPQHGSSCVLPTTSNSSSLGAATTAAVGRQMSLGAKREQPLWQAAVFGFDDPSLEAAHQAALGAACRSTDLMYLLVQVSASLLTVREAWRSGLWREAAASCTLHGAAVLTNIVSVAAHYTGLQGRALYKARLVSFVVNELLMLLAYAAVLVYRLPLFGAMQNSVIRAPLIWDGTVMFVRPFGFQVKPQWYAIQAVFQGVVAMIRWRANPAGSALRYVLIDWLLVTLITVAVAWALEVRSRRLSLQLVVKKKVV